MKKVIFMTITILVLLALTFANVFASFGPPLILDSRVAFHNSVIDATETSSTAAIRADARLAQTVSYFDFINIVDEVEFYDIRVWGHVIDVEYRCKVEERGTLIISWFRNVDVENYVDDSLSWFINTTEISHNGNRMTRTIIYNRGRHEGNAYDWVENGYAVSVRVPHWLLDLYPEETFFDIQKVNIAMPNTFTTNLVRLDNRIFDLGERPVMENNRTLVPIRAISEALGADVDWNNDTREVTLVADESLTFAIGELAVGMDVPAQIVNDRTFVPLRFISEFFGANVDWNEETQTVIITTE